MHAEVEEVRPPAADVLIVVEALVKARLYSSLRDLLPGLGYLSDEDLGTIIDAALPALGKFAIDVVLRLPWPRARRGPLLALQSGKKIGGNIVRLDFPREPIPGTADYYRWCNPGIALRPGGGYLLTLRGVNYDQRGAKVYHSLSPDGVIRTKNFLFELSPSFRPISRRPILCKLDFHPSVKGVEDLRPFYHRERLYVSGCFRSPTFAKMVVGVIDWRCDRSREEQALRCDRSREEQALRCDRSREEGHVYTETNPVFISPVVELESPRSWHEKNWLFDETRMLYAYPLSVVHLDWGEHLPRKEVRHEKLLSAPNFSELRGSAVCSCDWFEEIHDRRSGERSDRPGGAELRLEEREKDPIARISEGTRCDRPWKLVMTHWVANEMPARSNYRPRVGRGDKTKEVLCSDRDDRRTLHRFLLYKGDSLVGATEPLVLDEGGVEACHSMVVEGSKLVLAVGIEDREARLQIIDKEDILALMRPIGDWSIRGNLL